MKILVVNHFFDQDIEAMADANETHDIRVLSYGILEDIAIAQLPEEIRADFSYNTVDLPEVKFNYTRALEELFDQIYFEFPFDVLVTPSDTFYWIRELVQILKERNIPVVVVDKEGMISPYFFNAYWKDIRDRAPFISDYLLVWSHRQKNFWKMAGVDERRIMVTGQPRSDFWHKPYKWKQKNELGLGLNSEKKMVLFFSYDPWAYIPWHIYEGGKVSWQRIRKETHSALMSFARQRNDVEIIIKMHPQQAYPQEMNKLVANESLKNVFLTGGAILSNQLIINADVVVGFLTTAVAEAMITAKQIIYTFWDDARFKWSEEIIPYHKSGAVEIAKSPDELKRKIAHALENPKVSPSIQKKTQRVCQGVLLQSGW